MFAFFELSQCFDQGSSFCHFFLRVDCEDNRPSFHATVFQSASAFNGDVNKWNVMNVNNMDKSKFFIRDILIRFHGCFGPLRVTRQRLHACSAIMRLPYEISCVLAADLSF
jgi:hypothetical protein